MYLKKFVTEISSTESLERDFLGTHAYFLFDPRVFFYRGDLMIRGGQKHLKKLNRPKNQTETEPKNRLIEPNSLVLIFVLHKSQFRFTK